MTHDIEEAEARILARYYNVLRSAYRNIIGKDATQEDLLDAVKRGARPPTKPAEPVEPFVQTDVGARANCPQPGGQIVQRVWPDGEGTCT